MKGRLAPAGPTIAAMLLIIGLSSTAAVGGSGYTKLHEKLDYDMNLGHKNFEVTAKIVVTDAVPAIRIYDSAPGDEETTIDLQGHTVEQSSSHAGGVIDISGLKKVRIKNGTVRRNSDGPVIKVSGPAANGIILENLVIIGGTTGVLLDNVDAYRVENCKILTPNSVGGSVGLQMIAASTAKDGEIKGLHITGYLQGIRVHRNENSRTTIENNVLLGPNMSGGTGINAFARAGVNAASGKHNTDINNNTVSTFQNGIIIGAGNEFSVDENKIYSGVNPGSNEWVGIWLQADASFGLIRRNHVTKFGDGIRMAGFKNYLKENVVQDNVRYGIYVESGQFNRFRDNSSHSNVGTGAAGCSNGTAPCGSPNYCNNGFNQKDEGGNYMEEACSGVGP